MNRIFSATDCHVNGGCAWLEETQVTRGDILAEEEKGLWASSQLIQADQCDELRACVPSSASVTSSPLASSSLRRLFMMEGYAEVKWYLSEVAAGSRDLKAIYEWQSSNLGK